MAGDDTGSDLLNAFFATRQEETLGRVVQHYLGLVYGTAYRQVSDPGKAEEVTQNVFIALARRAMPFASAAAATGWLYRTTLLQARQQWRAEYRRRAREAAAVALGTTMNQDDAGWQKLLPLLDEALSRLREPERRALLLRFFEEKSMREVGAALGISEDAAQKRVASSLDKLGLYFEKAGYRVSAVSLLAAAVADTASAIPAGIAGGLAKTALLKAGAVPFAGLGVWTLKVMGLNKGQTAALCLVLSAGPVAYQGVLQSEERQRRELSASHVSAAMKALELATAEREELAEANRRLREHLELLRRAAQARSAPVTKEKEIAWSSQLPTISVPRHLLDQIGIPALGKDGQLTEDMVRVLGLNETQTQEVNGALRAFSAGYAALEAERTHPTAEHPSSMRISPVKDQRSFISDESSEAYQALVTRLQSLLDEQMGEEGSAYFWKNAGDGAWREFDPEKAGRAKRMTLFRPEKEQPGGGPYILGVEYQYENGSWGSASMGAVEEDEVSSPMLREVIAEWRRTAEKR